MAPRRQDQKLRAEVPAALAALLAVPEAQVAPPSADPAASDLVVSVAGVTFVVEVLGSAAPRAIAAHAARAAEAHKKLRRRATPLIAAPFMSDAGRRACAAADISWFDLSGNAHIVAPGLRVIVDGRPDRFKKAGRPASLFAPKSARIARWLLMHPQEAFIQRELARATDMTEGLVSRLVARLERDGYVVRPGGSEVSDVRRKGFGFGAKSGERRSRRPPVRVSDAAQLLDAWRDEYRFDKHTVVAGHVAARSGEELARSVSDALERAGIEHAATGLVAAWQMTRYAAFRLTTFFVADEPSDQWKEALGFREDPRGANLWLVVPNDAGVFQGAEPRAGIRCVHPVQAYLDLKGHPERAPEAAERLRAECLTWERDA